MTFAIKGRDGMGLERWLSGQEDLLSFRVQFPASTFRWFIAA